MLQTLLQNVDEEKNVAVLNYIFRNDQSGTIRSSPEAQPLIPIGQADRLIPHGLPHENR